MFYGNINFHNDHIIQMLKQSLSHRRNKSELLMYINKKKKPSKTNKKKQDATANGKKILHPTLVGTLLNKSSKKMVRKQILVQDLDEVCEENPPEQFFYFGKGVNTFRVHSNLPQMQEIIEVPDTGSYSHRNTEQEKIEQNKQNIQYYYNCPLELKKKDYRYGHRSTQKEYETTMALINNRQNNNCSRKSSQKSQRSDCENNRSTVQLHRQKLKKNRSKSSEKRDCKGELKNLRQKTAKLENSIKMIWTCMGEIWQSNKSVQHVNLPISQLSERNNERLDQLFKREKYTQKQLLQLKLNHQKRAQGIYLR